MSVLAQLLLAFAGLFFAVILLGVWEDYERSQRGK